MKQTKRRASKRFEKKRNFLSLFIFSAVVLTLVVLFSRNAPLSEWYMNNIYPAIATILSSASHLFPFSIYDIFIVVAILYLLQLTVFVVIKRTSFKDFTYSLIRFATVLVAWFYLGWGISYFRKDFYSRTNIQETSLNVDNLRDFTSRFIADANNSYVEFEVIEKESIRKEIEKTYNSISDQLAVNYPNGKRKVKKMIFESLFTKMGISGYYGPFFNEIHVNDYSLDFTYPFTLAHEMAHQFGIAKESEANLYAFIVCTNSEDKRIRYSAYASTIGYLLNDVRIFMPDEYEDILYSVKPEIIEDLQRNREHWLSARNNTLSDAQDRAYDAYLKSNRISSGRENYSEVVGLLISSYDSFTTIK